MRLVEVEAVRKSLLVRPLVASEATQELNLNFGRDASEQLRITRWQTFAQLQAYFWALKYAVSEPHISCLESIVVFMTQDEDHTRSILNGPIPLFFRPDTKIAEQFPQYDYRDLNDDRAAIVDIDSDRVNDRSLIAFLAFDQQTLEQISQGITERMRELRNYKDVRHYAALCRKWEKQSGYDQSLVVTNTDYRSHGDALKDLRSVYLLALDKLSGVLPGWETRPTL